MKSCASAPLTVTVSSEEEFAKGMASSTLLIPAPAVGPCRLMTSTLVTVPLAPSSTGGPKNQDIVVQIERIDAGAAVENVVVEIVKRNVREYVVAAVAVQDVGAGAAVEMCRRASRHGRSRPSRRRHRIAD